MEKNFVEILGIFSIIFLLFFLSNCAKTSDKNLNGISIYNGDKIIKINAEIADDSNEIARGLMFREKLDKNSGMLFIFKNEYYQTFWMKNTLIPLDMIFINSSKKIVDIKLAVPCLRDPCLLYRSSRPSKYVLELNGNFTIRNNIKIGDSITLNQ